MGSVEYTQLKLLAIVLTEPLFSMVLAQQNYISERWAPRHALRTPPHLTLIEPIGLSKKEVSIVQMISAAAGESHAPFQIRMSGFGAFAPRAIFINPDYQPELTDLQNFIRNQIWIQMPHTLQRYNDRKFHPHITLAHKDLNTDQFEMIWKYYENLKLDLEFTVNRFHILGHHSTGWEVEDEYFLNPQS